MENEGDFAEKEGLQKNEEDELLQDNLNDEIGEENTSLSKGTKITQKIQKEESEGDLLANLIKRKVEKLPRQLRIMCETELYQILLKYEM